MTEDLEKKRGAAGWLLLVLVPADSVCVSFVAESNRIALISLIGA